MDIGEQIFELMKTMDEIGFDGSYFTIKSSYPALLGDSLRGYMEAVKEGLENASPSPFGLQTILSWKESEGNFAMCVFMVKYEQESGFSISKVKLQLMDLLGTDRFDKSFHEIPVSKTGDTPKREALISVAKELKAGLKAEEVKGLRYRP